MSLKKIYYITIVSQTNLLNPENVCANFSVKLELHRILIHFRFFKIITQRSNSKTAFTL